MVLKVLVVVELHDWMLRRFESYALQSTPLYPEHAVHIQSASAFEFSTHEAAK